MGVYSFDEYKTSPEDRTDAESMRQDTTTISVHPSQTQLMGIEETL